MRWCFRISILILIVCVVVTTSWSKMPVSQKLDCRLRIISGDYESTLFRTSMLQQSNWLNGKKVQVEIRINVLAKEALDQLRKSGLRINSYFGGLVSGTISQDQLLDLAALEIVSTVYPAFEPFRVKPELNFSQQEQSQDEFDIYFPFEGEGVSALKADVVHLNIPHFGGAGVKVGIISDSFGIMSENQPVYADINEDGIDDIVGTDSQLLGELPITISVVEEANPIYDEDGNPIDFPYMDEGRAMAEIVHEMAPDAELYFHAAFNNGNAGAAAAILNLANAGCTVITDDSFYLNEPMFQDGEIAQAIDHVSNASDVVFITAAGNLNVNSIYTQYYDINPEYNNEEWTKLPNDFDFHNWDRAFAATEYLPITVHPGTDVRITLHWENPFSGLLGDGASTDYDLYVFDDNHDLVTLSDNFEGTVESPYGDPFEIVGFSVPIEAEAPATFYLAVNKHHGPAVPFRLTFFGNNDRIKLSNNRIDHSLQYGRNLAETALSVAAVNVFELLSGGTLLDNPYTIDPTIYSSKGGLSPIFFSPDGEKLEQPDLRYVPQLSSVDGTNNSFFGGYGNDGIDLPNFYGTSAASPHLAGIAALVRQANPDLSSLEVRELLIESAVDIFEPGLDPFTGHGMVYADLAVQAALDKRVEQNPEQTPVIINTPTPVPPTPTPTITPTPTEIPLVPVGGVIVSDHGDTYQDLSGGLDIDPPHKRDLAIHWNLDMNDLKDVHVYISVNGQDFQYLGRTGSGDETTFVWEENNQNIATEFKQGPEHSNYYQFSIYLLTESGNPHFYGPYYTGYVEYYIN